MENQSGELTYAPPNALGDAFVSPGNGGVNLISTVSTLYTLTNVGDLLYLNPNSGIVDVSTLPTISALETNTQGITYTPDTTTISNNVDIPYQYNFAHNPENNTTFPDHIINANLQVGQPSVIPGNNPDVQFYPTTFSIGDPIRVARSINLYSGALGTTITSVQGVSIDATVDVNANAGGVVAIDSGGATTINSGAGVTIDAVGAVNLTAGGTITINGVGLTEIGGGDVTINSVNKQETTTGDTNITCSAFTAQMGAVDIVSGVMGIQAGAFDLVSLAGFGFQGAGPVSFLTAGSYSFGGGDANFATTSLRSSNLIISTINGLPYVPSSSSSNWSQYPANSAVNVAGYTMSNVGTIIGTTSQFGTALAGQTLTTALTAYSDAYIGSNLYVSSIVAQGALSASTIQATNAITTPVITANLLLGNTANISTINTGVFTTNTILATQINGQPISQYNNANWANNSAIGNVNMAGYNLNATGTIYANAINTNWMNTSNITCSNAIAGATLQISTINGTPYNPASPPSAWALYPAQQFVNMGGYGFSNVLSLSYWTNDPAVTDGTDTLFTETLGADKISASSELATTSGCTVDLNGNCTANGYYINPNFNQYYNASNPTIIDVTAGKNNDVYWLYPTGSDYDFNWNFPLNGSSQYGRYEIMSGLPIGGNNLWLNIRIYANTIGGTLLQYDRIQLNPGQIVMFETYPFNGGTQATWVTYKVGASGPTSTGIGG